MATDVSRIQGEITEDPRTEEIDVEALLVGFVRALIAESVANSTACKGALN